LAPETDEWRSAADLNGFTKYRSAMEALSWNAAYRQHALMLAQGEAPSLGLFQGVGLGTGTAGRYVISGAAHHALIEAEKQVARDALARHSVDEDHLIAAASWLGWRAKWRRDAGYVEVGRAYANLMRDAIELLISVGYSLAEVLNRMKEGDYLVNQHFPVWLDQARIGLKHWITARAQEYNARPDLQFPDFNDLRVAQFVEWLESAGRFGAHMSIAAIEEYGQRMDRDAAVGVAMHVTNLAAWVEHVCNEALGPSWKGGNTLDPKLQGCWSKHPVGPRLRSAFGRCTVPNGTQFRDGVPMVLATSGPTGLGWMARDARLTCLIRNEGLHRGLSGLDRRELHDAACILLRTAMGAWLTTHP